MNIPHVKTPVSLIKRHPVIWSFVGIFVLALFVGYAFSGETPETYDTVIATRSDLVQEVEVTGKVRPAEERELAFQRGGTVGAVHVSVGDSISAGQTIASLDTSELQAQLRQAEAMITQEENILAELTRGSRPEELTVVYTSVENAQRSLESAETAYDTAVAKANADIALSYDSAITTTQSGVISAKSALVVLSEIQYDQFISEGVSAPGLSDAKAHAVEKLFGVSDTGNWTAEYISELSGGLYAQVQSTDPSANKDDLDRMMQDALEGLSYVSDALNATPVLATFTATEKADLSAQKTAISSAVTALAGKIRSVEVQKASNISTLNAALSSVTAAENTLRAANDQKALKEAGSTEEALATQSARVSSAYAQKELIRAQIDTMVLRSPINGTITKQDVRRGVFVQAGVPVVSIISKSSFEVETYVTEVDIAKVSVGDPANVTLDAYSDEDIFKAAVTSIDPAETVIEGVSAYKVTLSFVEAEDARILSGMTANADIMTDSRTGVFAVPTRSLITEGSQKYLRVLQGGEVVKVPVTVGLKGSDGRTEIVEGLSGGEEVVTFIRK